MARALGRRSDETSDAQSQKRGPETWALAALVVVIVLAAIGLLLLAA
jgi:hypothetical protein